MFTFVEENNNVIGIQTDHGYDVQLNGEHVGYIYTSDLGKEIFLEWVEIEKSKRGKHYFRQILLEYMEVAHTKRIYFYCGEDVLPIYQNIGSIIVEHNAVREMHCMRLTYDDLKKCNA